MIASLKRANESAQCGNQSNRHAGMSSAQTAEPGYVSSRLRSWAKEGKIVAIRLNRAYAPAEPDDGFRILVDRLWPRGLVYAAHEERYNDAVALNEYLSSRRKKWAARISCVSGSQSSPPGRGLDKVLLDAAVVVGILVHR